MLQILNKTPFEAHISCFPDENGVDTVYPILKATFDLSADGVAVADTGDGIPAEIAGKIFDPLFTTKAKGIGLGLAVCKSIIENHRGGISVSSEVGKGTTFLIKLPLNVTESQGRVSQ